MAWWPLLLSVLCNGARYHLDAAALKTASPTAVVFVGSLSAAVAFVLGGVVCRGSRINFPIFTEVDSASIRHAWSKTKWILLCGAAAGAAGGWLMVAANQHYGPAITSFLGNLTLVYLLLAGIAGGERFRWPELFAVFVIGLGAFIFSYKGGSPQWGALGLMGGGCLLVASKQLLTKKATGMVHLPSAMTLSLFLMAFWGLVLGLASGDLNLGSNLAIMLMAGGGVLGSMIGMSLIYVGYHRVGVARGSAIDAMRPLAVLLIGVLIGNAVPTSVQFLGAALILGGSAVLPLLSMRRLEVEGLS